MSVLDGITQCWPLAERCQVWWEAWAVAIAFLGLAVATMGAVIAYFGVLGSWAAACATYMAVVQPLKRRQLEEKVAIDLAMENFAGELIDLRYNVGAMTLSVAWLNGDNPAGAKASVKRLSIRNISIPSPTPTPENRRMIEALNRLRRAIKSWNRQTTTFDIEPDPACPSDFAEIVIGNLKHQLQVVLNETRDVAAAMRNYAPAYAQELQWVADSGDGFVAFYGDGDRF